jgi:hypothetical protein
MTSTTLPLLAPEASASARSATNPREPRFVVGTGGTLDQSIDHLQGSDGPHYHLDRGGALFSVRYQVRFNPNSNPREGRTTGCRF